MKAFAPTLTTLAALTCLLLTPANCDVLDDATVPASNRRLDATFMAPASNRRLLRRDSTGKGRGKNDKSDVLDDEIDVGFGWWQDKDASDKDVSAASDKDVEPDGDDKRGWWQDAVTVVPGKGWTDRKPDGGKPNDKPDKGDGNDNDKPPRPWRPDKPDKPGKPGWPGKPEPSPEPSPDPDEDPDKDPDDKRPFPGWGNGGGGKPGMGNGGGGGKWPLPGKPGGGKPDDKPGKGDGDENDKPSRPWKPGRPGWPGKPAPSPEPTPDPDDGLGNGGGGGKWPLPGLGNGGGGKPGKRPFKLVAYVSLLMNKWRAKRPAAQKAEGGQGSAQEAEAEAAAEAAAEKKTEVLKKTSGSVAKAFGERLKREDASIDAEQLEIGLEQVSTFTLQCAKGLHSDEALLRYATIAACRGRRLCRVSRGNATNATGPASMPSDVPPTLTEGGFGKARRLSTAAFTFVVVLTLGANETLDAPLQLEEEALASSDLTVSAAPTVVEVRFTVAMADAGAWQPANSSAAMSSEALAAAFGSSVGSTQVLSGALGAEVGQDAIVIIPTVVVAPAAPATPGAAPPPPAAEEPHHRHHGHKEEEKGSKADIAMIAGAAVAGVLCVALLAFAAVLLRSRSRRGDAMVATYSSSYSAGGVKAEKPTAAQKEGSFEKNNSLSSDKV